jgi:hypothetical protein
MWLKELSVERSVERDTLSRLPPSKSAVETLLPQTISRRRKKKTEKENGR